MSVAIQQLSQTWRDVTPKTAKTVDQKVLEQLRDGREWSLDELAEKSGLSKLVSNPEIEHYLSTRHPEILDEFRAIISAASFDQSVPVAN